MDKINFFHKIKSLGLAIQTPKSVFRNNFRLKPNRIWLRAINRMGFAYSLYSILIVFKELMNLLVARVIQSKI